MTTKELNKLMSWNMINRDYVKVIKGVEYKVLKNCENNKWHLYTDGEWSFQVQTLKEGKLLAIVEAYKLA